MDACTSWSSTSACAVPWSLQERERERERERAPQHDSEGSSVTRSHFKTLHGWCRCVAQRGGPIGQQTRKDRATAATCFPFFKKDLDGPAAMDDDAAHCRGRAVPLRWMARSSSLSKIDRRLLATPAVARAFFWASARGSLQAAQSRQVTCTINP